MTQICKAIFACAVLACLTVSCSNLQPQSFSFGGGYNYLTSDANIYLTITFKNPPSQEVIQKIKDAGGYQVQSLKQIDAIGYVYIIPHANNQKLNNIF